MRSVAVWLLGLAVCAWIVFTRTTYDADLTAFLPKSSMPAQRLLIGQLRDGVASRLLLIGLEGGSSEARAATSKALAQALAPQPIFNYVANGEQSLSKADRELLFKYRYLLSDRITPERFTEAGLREALQETLDLLSSPLGSVFGATLAADPTGELAHVIAPLAGRAGPRTEHGVWFSGDGGRALLMAETAAAGYDLDAQKNAQQAVVDAFDKARASPEIRLLMTGPAVFGVQSRAAIEGDAWRLSLIATVMVVLILALAYRSARLVAFGALPVLTGALAGIAAVSVVFGGVHGITLGFGATLIGEAVDYPTYLFTQRAAGETMREAVRRIWPTLRLAVLTTVFGSTAMLLSSFTGLAQLGLFSLAGVLAAGLVTRFVLPAASERAFGARVGSDTRSVTKEPPVGLPLRLRRLAGWRPAAVSAVVMIAAASAVLIGLRQATLWEDDIANFNPISEESKALDESLRSALGAPDVSLLLVATAPSRDAALERCERLRPLLDKWQAMKLVSGYETPCAYLRSQATQTARRDAVPEPAVLERRLQAAMKDLPFRDNLFQPFLADVERTRTGPLMQVSDLQGSAAGLALRSLLIEQDGQWAALAPLAGVTDIDRLRTEVERSAGESVLLFDLKAESNRMISSYRDQSLWLGLGGIALIAIVLAFGLRSARAVAWVMAPVLAAMLASTALLVAGGVKLSLFHLVALLLVLGIGVNYALFFNRDDRRTGSNLEDEGPRAERRRVAFSVLVCASTTICAFGALAFSATPVLRAIGVTVAIGAVLSLLFSAALAPAAGARSRAA